MERAVAPPIYVARDVPSVLIHGDRGAQAARAVPHLTPRELEVLRLVEGRSNREVARLLWVTDDTVKFHLANTYRKLGVSSRSEAVAWARERGLLESRPTQAAAAWRAAISGACAARYAARRAHGQGRAGPRADSSVSL